VHDYNSGDLPARWRDGATCAEEGSCAGRVKQKKATSNGRPPKNCSSIRRCNTGSYVKRSQEASKRAGRGKTENVVRTSLATNSAAGNKDA